MNDWPIVNLGAVVDVTDYVANGSFESLRLNVSYSVVPEFAVLVRLVDHNNAWAGPFTYVNRHSYEFLRKSSLAVGDVVVANVGANAGTVFRVPDLGVPMTLGPNSVLCRPRNPREYDQGFMYYFLSAPAGQSLIESIISGSAQPKFNKTGMRQLPVPVPPIALQRAIAEALGALDDKIAANAKLAATTDEYLGAHFQREMSNGFESASLGTIADVNAESVKPVDGGQLRYIDIASVGVGTHAYPVLTSWEEAPSRARRRVRQGDTLWSTVRPNRRSHSLNMSEDPRLVASTGLAVLSPREVGFAYLYEATRLPEFATYLENVAEGSAYPAVRANLFTSAPIPLVAPDRRAAFEALAAPMRKHLHSLSKENRTLATTRDTLLSELMSGRLRVQDAEKKIEEAV